MISVYHPLLGQNTADHLQFRVHVPTCINEIKFEYYTLIYSHYYTAYRARVNIHIRDYELNIHIYIYIVETLNKMYIYIIETIN